MKCFEVNSSCLCAKFSYRFFYNIQFNLPFSCVSINTESSFAKVFFCWGALLATLSIRNFGRYTILCGSAAIADKLVLPIQYWSKQCFKQFESWNQLCSILSFFLFGVQSLVLLWKDLDVRYHRCWHRLLIIKDLLSFSCFRSIPNAGRIMEKWIFDIEVGQQDVHLFIYVHDVKY